MTTNELQDKLNEAMDNLIKAFHEEYAFKKNLLIQDAELVILNIKSALLLDGITKLNERLDTLKQVSFLFTFYKN